MVYLPIDLANLPEDRKLKNDGFKRRSKMNEDGLLIGGVQDKYYNRETRQYIKIDSPVNQRDESSEGLREDLIYHFIQNFNFNHIVDYKSVAFEDESGHWVKAVVTNDFKYKNEVEFSFLDLKVTEGRISIRKDNFDIVDDGEILIPDQILMLSKYGEFLYIDYLKIIAFDAITNNHDRYYNDGNFGILRNEKTEEVRLLPPFDNGGALAENYHSNQVRNNIDKTMNLLKTYSINQPPLLANEKEILQSFDEYNNPLYSRSTIDNFIDYLKFALAYSKNKLWRDSNEN